MPIWYEMDYFSCIMSQKGYLCSRSVAKENPYNMTIKFTFTFQKNEDIAKTIS